MFFSFSQHTKSTVPKAEPSKDLLPTFSLEDGDNAHAIMVEVKTRWYLLLS